LIWALAKAGLSPNQPFHRHFRAFRGFSGCFSHLREGHRLPDRNKQELYERRWMGLFNAELYRSFAIGFGVGALMFVMMIATQFLTA
jgi:hypothetical protein